MNRIIRYTRMEAAKQKFIAIWKDLNVLVTECENDKMEDMVLISVRETRALASAGEKYAASCIREDKRLEKLESGE